MDTAAAEDNDACAPRNARVRAVVALRGLNNCAAALQADPGAVVHRAHRPYDFEEFLL